MLFNSIEFAVFLPVVFFLYWLLNNKNLKLQNLLIVIASYVFYGWWDWRFLFLIFISTTIDYGISLKMFKSKNQKIRRHLLILSVFVNLGLLFFFKYFNFFIDNFISSFSFFGIKLKYSSLNIILPVGISFYTFQTLGYTIDVFRKKIKPTNNYIVFSAYVAFFPQLVAGPIERASNLLPQFTNKRHFKYENAIDGCRQILWGFVKKLVIADNCSILVNHIFENTPEYHGSTLILGAILFSIQIYCDFSGYSDMAIGTAKLFGFNLMQNFNSPYFSRDIAEFWRRWHISLSTWFRDYLYIPLGGSRVDLWKKIRNIILIFLISGFWHGPNWTFIIWGGIHATLFLPLILMKKNRTNLNTIAHSKRFPNIKELLNVFLTFGTVTFSWIFFRANNLDHALQYIYQIFSPKILSIPKVNAGISLKMILMIIVIFFLIEWIGRKNEYALQFISSKSKLYKYSITFFITIVILLFMHIGEQDFIYFQF